jgi:uncharacterized protein YuzB (UPF0349 family)
MHTIKIELTGSLDQINTLADALKTLVKGKMVQGDKPKELSRKRVLELAVQRSLLTGEQIKIK